MRMDNGTTEEVQQPTKHIEEIRLPASTISRTGVRNLITAIEEQHGLPTIEYDDDSLDMVMRVLAEQIVGAGYDDPNA